MLTGTNACEPIKSLAPGITLFKTMAPINVVDERKIRELLNRAADIYRDIFQLPQFKNLDFSLTQRNSKNSHGLTDDQNSGCIGVIFLNDNYSGGDIIFREFVVQHKPKKGDILMFPHHFMYRFMIAPVTSGTQTLASMRFIRENDDTAFSGTTETPMNRVDLNSPPELTVI